MEQDSVLQAQIYLSSHEYGFVFMSVGMCGLRVWQNLQDDN